MHADPHPGNFLVSEEGQLIALDFGCMKLLPEDFYAPYFELFNIDVLEDPRLFHDKLLELEILRIDDSEGEVACFTNMFHDVLSFLTQPFREETFNFSDQGFFDKLGAIGERYFKDTRTKKMNANRGSRHFIYMNRTFFGLFNLMFDLKAENIRISNFKNL